MSLTTLSAKIYLASFQHREALWDPLLNEYRKRIQKLAQLDWKVFKPTASRLASSQSFIKYYEKLNKPSGPVIILDEHGSAVTTKLLSDKLLNWLDLGQAPTFLIGGAEGLELEPLLKLPKVVCWSLSSLTLPHRLAQLTLLEQLYRALTIINHLPYHRA